MPVDIFNREQNVLGGAWTAEGAAVNFSSTTANGSAAAKAIGSGMIVQQVNIGYQQQVTRLYEIGSDKTYYVGGRVQGNMTIGRIVGPGVTMSAFYAAFGDVCNAFNNTLNLYIGTGCYKNQSADTADFTNARLTISYVILINVGISVGAQDMVINEQLQMMFVNMSSQDSGGTTDNGAAGSVGGLGGVGGALGGAGLGAFSGLASAAAGLV